MEGAMRCRQYTLTSREVHQCAAEFVQLHLGLKDYSRRCPVSVLLHVLFFAAARVGSIYAACQRLTDAPGDQTIRDALFATLPEYAELQRLVNRALAGELPKALRRRRQYLAIDLTLLPYHGEAWKDEKEIYRSQAKSGTSHFHAYATAYLVCRGRRFSVALTRVEKGEKMAEVVKRLLRLAARAGVKPRFLLLDKGFFSVEVIRYLQCARIPFVMPAKVQGPKPKRKRSATGIRAFKQWKKSGWGTHTWTDSKRRRATVRIGVYCGNHRGRWKRRGRFAWVYAFWGFQPGSPRWLADTYRLRFGIESSYRQLNQARIRTSTRNPLIRFFFVALALILRNVWVWFHWQVLSHPRRGMRGLCLERMRFQTMLLWLLHVAESVLGVSDEAQTERPPPTRLRAA
jgi:hypothetical protein